MGYYTEYSFSVIEGDDFKTNYEEEIAEISGYGIIGEDAIKWYDHEKDMIELSKRHLNTVFKLEGDGEESGDIWVKYFRNGKMQKSQAKVVLKEYDESKLE